MSGFPQSCVLQPSRRDNNNRLRYLRYMHEDGEYHGHLQFSGPEAISPYTKFALEPAKDQLGNKGLFHVRCCYNNKYWACKTETGNQVIAEANVPEEDRSKHSCTLFELSLDHSATPKTVKLRHVYLNRYVSTYGLTLSADMVPDSDFPRDTFNFEIIDWDSFVILPKKVVFKGDNDRYLSFRRIEGNPDLTFDSKDVGLPTLPNSVFYNPDGSIRIRSDYAGKFWRRSPNWICADSSDITANNPDTLFWVVKGQGDNEVALRNLGNNHFCKRLTTVGRTNYLHAGVLTMTKEAIMKVEEPVVSRSIYNVNFHLKDSRIYDETAVTIMNKRFTNSSNVPHDTTITKTITTETTKLWKASISVMLGVKTTLVTGLPKIFEGKVEISSGVTTALEYGKQVKETESVTISNNVTVRPRTTIRVQVIATEGKCDVPFSYMQRDTLTNGEQVTHEMHDGVYTGSNCYNFHTEVSTVSKAVRADEGPNENAVIIEGNLEV